MSESDFVFCNLLPRGNSVSGWITSTNQFVELTQEILGNMRLSGCSLFAQEGKDVLYGNYKSTVINEDFSLKITPYIVGGNHFLVQAEFDGWLESNLAIAETGNVIVLYASDWTLEDKLKYMGSFSDCQNCESQYSCGISRESKEVKLKQCGYYRERIKDADT